MHALAQLGATEALPAFDLATQSKSVDPNYLKAMRQRLLAENLAAKTLVEPNRAATKITAFYRGLNLSPSDMNTANSNVAPLVAGKSIPPEVLATREIADMVYHGNYADYASLDGLAQISNTSDMPSALKLRLAPLSQAVRVQTLIDDLAQSQTLGMKQRYEMQLADDQGTLASHIAVVKLQEMDQHREVYPKEGFDAIFSVLSGAGDATQAKLVEHYTHDQNGYIAYFANNVYADVQAGHHGIFAPDY